MNVSGMFSYLCFLSLVKFVFLYFSFLSTIVSLCHIIIMIIICHRPSDRVKIDRQDIFNEQDTERLI